MKEYPVAGSGSKHPHSAFRALLLKLLEPILIELATISTTLVSTIEDESFTDEQVMERLTLFLNEAAKVDAILKSPEITELRAEAAKALAETKPPVR